MKSLSRFHFFSILLAVGLVFLGFAELVWSAPKGKLIIAQGAEHPSLDPHQHSANFTFAVVHQMYDHIAKRVFKDGRVQHIPALATSWEAVNDKTWVFHLRKGVKFHNGEEFNAEAIKYSIERVLNPAEKARWRYAFTMIERVEIVDPYTVKIFTSVPSPQLILNLCYAMPIVAPKYYKEKGSEYVATRPVGTGPFKFVRWVKDEELVLEANENYWDGAPNIKTLVFKPIPEDATRVAALLGGDVDICKHIPSHLIPMVNKSNKAEVLMAESALNIHIVLNTTYPKGTSLADRRVRQAINYAVDVDSIIKYVLEGYGKRAVTVLTPAHFGNDPNLKPYPYDPQKAKALLKEAGYKEGDLTLTLRAPAGRYEKGKEVVEATGKYLEKIGIKVKLEIQEWGTYQKGVWDKEKGNGDMYLLGWGATYDADQSFKPLLGCGEGRSRWCNKEFDKLIEQAGATLDQKKRERLYHQAGKICRDEAAMLFMYYGVDTYGVNKRVQNWKPTTDEATALRMDGVSLRN